MSLSPIVSRVPADNKDEMNVVLKTKVYTLERGTGQRVLTETILNGPYYRDMAEKWIENAIEKSGGDFHEWELVPAASVRSRDLEYPITYPYKRFLCTHEDGTTSFEYAL